MAGQRVLPRVRATRSFARLLAAILLVGGLAFGLVAYPQPQPASAAAFATGDTVVVNTDRLNLREAPSLGATVLHVLLGGSTMTVTGAPVKADGYNWYPVDAWVSGPTSGWVAGEYLAYATDGGNGGGDDGWYGGFGVGDVAMVDTARLNCRTGPGLGYAVDHVMDGGAKVTVLDGPVGADGYHWFKLAMADGAIGWSIGEGLAPTGGSPDPGGSGGAFAKGADVVVDADALSLRSGAGLSYGIIRTLSRGTALIVSNGPIAADGYDWYEVETRTGDLGWVAGAYLASATGGGGGGGWVPSFAIGSTAVVDTPRLNSRTGPGLSSAVDHVLDGGAKVTVLEGPVSADGYHWYKLETANGDVGWSIGEGLR